MYVPTLTGTVKEKRKQLEAFLNFFYISSDAYYGQDHCLRYIRKLDQFFNSVDKLKGVKIKKIKQEIEEICDDDDDELPESLKVARE